MNDANLGDWVVFLINQFSHSARIYIACSFYQRYLFTQNISSSNIIENFCRIMYSVLILFLILLIDCSLENEFWSKKKRPTIKCEEAGVSKVRRKSKCDTSEDQEIQAIGGRDASIFLFHALGKIIYCKSKKTLTCSPFQWAKNVSCYQLELLK